MDTFGQNAFAFALFENAPAAAGPIQGRGEIEVLATQDGRALVRLSGALVSGTAFSKMVSEERSDNGVSSSPETLIVEPAPLPIVAAVSREWASWSRGWLTVLGIVFVLVALLMPVICNKRIVASSRNAEPQDVKAAHTFPAVSFFQPIATQDELANLMGTHKSNISRLETGNSNPSWKTLKKYAHACGFKITMGIQNL